MSIASSVIATLPGVECPNPAYDIHIFCLWLLVMSMALMSLVCVACPDGVIVRRMDKFAVVPEVCVKSASHHTRIEHDGFCVVIDIV